MSKVRKSIIGALVLVPLTLGIIKWIAMPETTANAGRKSDRRIS